MGEAIAEREDHVVGVFHALRHPPATSETDDEEMHASALTEFSDEGLQGVLCMSGRRILEMSFTQPGSVPETECLHWQEVPVVIARAEGDRLHVACRDGAICADHQIDQ